MWCASRWTRCGTWGRGRTPARSSCERRRERSGGHRDGGAGPAASHRPALDPAWYDAIAVRRSRRRYGDRRVDAAALEALRTFCDGFQLAPGARVELVEGDGGIFTGLLDRFGGAYGRVEGAPWTAAFIGPKGRE